MQIYRVSSSISNVALRPLNMLSICSGIGGLDIGVRLVLGGRVRTVCYVERGLYPAQVMATRMEDGVLQPAPIWSDIKTFDARRWSSVMDGGLLVGGYPCFVRGTRVLTRRGYRPIEDIKVGDNVLTHKGRWRSVTAIMRRSDAAVREIKAQGVPGIVCTDDHPFYTGAGEWTAARDLQRGLRVAQVLPPAIRDRHTESWWWVIGRYLADGWRGPRKDRPTGRTVICSAHQEAESLKSKIELAGWKPRREENRTTTTFHIFDKDLYRFLGQFGRYAHGKRIPGKFLGLPKEKAAALLDGYLSGDGCRQPNSRGSGGHWQVSSVSKDLALSIALLAQRARGVVATIKRYEPKSYKRIEGRRVRQRTRWVVVIPDRNRSGRIDGKYGWKRVRSNKPCGRSEVFNIAVAEDESYVADGAVVHNCQPFSSSGVRRGASDPKHLWPDVLRVLTESRAGFAFFENVLAHVQRGLQEVLEDLAASGFDAEWGVYSAQQIGAPHIRKRLFIFAFRPAVADAYRQRQLQQGGEVGEERGRASYCGAESGRPWASELGVHRLAHRVAHRLDRERATGNAVVPAVAGRAFAELSSRAGVDLRAEL